MLDLDASFGEGGGQILRTALALSVTTQTPVYLYNIRAKRPNPGLAPQHLACVQALATISNAKVEGAHLGSTTLTFSPEQPQPGNYHFSIPTAGSLTLLLHALYLPLARLPQESHLRLSGGSHVKWSPTFDYVETIWGEAMRKMGIPIHMSLSTAGFYPRGGGEADVHISPARELIPYTPAPRKTPLRAEGVIGISQLPNHVPARIQSRAEELLAPTGVSLTFTRKEYIAPSPGCAFLLILRWDGGLAGFDALGERGKPAEKVAEEAVRSCLKFLSTPATVDQHLADQLLLPTALARGVSQFHTPEVTTHLLTNAEVIRKFLRVDITIEGEPGHPGKISVHPLSAQTPP